MRKAAWLNIKGTRSYAISKAYFYNRFQNKNLEAIISIFDKAI